MDNELFELCKDVYDKFPDWNWPATTEKSFNPGTDHSIQFGWMPGSVPLYTSDYLLEKLPKKIKSDWWLNLSPELSINGAGTLWVADYQNDKSMQSSPIVVSNTPLKALLELTIALHEAGELK